MKAYGYLLGAPKRLRLLMPHEESSLKNSFKNKQDWNLELDRLFCEDGLVAFDLFSIKAFELLDRSVTIRNLFASRHPLIVVDEAQDTAEDQWQCIRLLSEKTQLICLADLEQQIYDFRPGVSPERVSHIIEALNPLRVDFQGQNHRSSSSEILLFANDVLTNTARGQPYKGVSRLNFRPDAKYRDAAIRRAVSLAYNAAKEAAAPHEIKNMAFLASWGRGVNLVSRALTGDGKNKNIQHNFVIDEVPLLLSSKLIAFLIEPRSTIENELFDLSDALEISASFFRGCGGIANLSNADRLACSAVSSRARKFPKTREAAGKLLDAMREIRKHSFSGDPREDWTVVRSFLSNSGSPLLRKIAEEAEHFLAFHRGGRIAGSLVDLWQARGSYTQARSVIDAAIAEDQLVSGSEDIRGLYVMTIHKAKGKEFDAVIILDESRNSPLNFCKEEIPYPRARRLLRVGLTRAKHHALLLVDLYRPSDLLNGHILS